MAPDRELFANAASAPMQAKRPEALDQAAKTRKA
jgi:hypothetical protein